MGNKVGDTAMRGGLAYQIYAITRRESKRGVQVQVYAVRTLPGGGLDYATWYERSGDEARETPDTGAEDDA